MRLSRDESAAMGVSGFASVMTSSEPTLTSSPPSFTRSSCFSSPVTRMKEPCESAEIASVVASASAAPTLTPSGSSSRVAGFTSCTAPDSSRRMTNCTFF